MSTQHPLKKLAAKCWQCLTDQRITLDGPGTVLRDIQVVMDCIGTDGLRTQSNRGNLPSAILAELNARLSRPIEVHLNRALLRDYPNIAGLFILLRVWELVRADSSRLWIDKAQLEAWKALNPAEQYFALLEAWLLNADSLVLGGDSRWRGDDDFSSRVYFLVNGVGSKWKTFRESVHTYGFGIGEGMPAWGAQLMLQLGLIEVVPRPLNQRSKVYPSRGWMMWKAKRTPWGEAVAWAILDHLAPTEKDEDLLSLAPTDDLDSGMMHSIFRTFFPDFQKVFGSPPPVEHPGVYVFKVGFAPRYGPSDVWRRLAVPHSATLDDLCPAVLKAFKFWDDDHLHRFRYRDRTGRSRVYWHPYSDEGPFSDEITLGESGLPEKGTLNFTFDFGNTWKFVLRLERIAPPDPKLRSIKVLESHDKPPPQYEDYELEP